MIHETDDMGLWTIDTDRFTVQIGSISINFLASSLQRSAKIPRSLLTVTQVWRWDEPPGPFSLREQGVGRNPTTIRVISRADNGDILADREFRDRASQALPTTNIEGTCVAQPGSMAFNSDSGQFSEEILIGTGMEVLIADPTMPLNTPSRLPIKVVVRVNGLHRQTLLLNDCANANVCSGHLDKIDANPGDTVTITATDAKGDVVAFESLTVP